MSTEKTTKVTDTAVKVETVAKVTEKKAEPVKKAAEVKTAEKKAEPVKKAVTKTTAKKTETTKKTVAKAVAKTTAKKAETTKKTTTKTATTKKEVETEVFLQYAGTEVSSKELVDRVIAACGEKPSAIKTINLYVQPETNKVYYTVNGDKGDIDLY